MSSVRNEQDPESQLLELEGCVLAISELIMAAELLLKNIVANSSISSIAFLSLTYLASLSAARLTAASLFIAVSHEDDFGSPTKPSRCASDLDFQHASMFCSSLVDRRLRFLGTSPMGSSTSLSAVDEPDSPMSSSAISSSSSL